MFRFYAELEEGVAGKICEASGGESSSESSSIREGDQNDNLQLIPYPSGQTVPNPDHPHTRINQ